MKYSTFRNLVVLGAVGATVTYFAECNHHPSHRVADPVGVVTQVEPTVPQAPANPQQPMHAFQAPVQTTAPVQPSLSTSQIQSQIEAWLTANPDRHGLMRANDVLPQAPFRATAIRFPEDTAGRFSNNPTQWSQIRLDLNRDGVDDEKWLLRNGHTYKRETLDANGHTLDTYYFN